MATGDQAFTEAAFRRFLAEHQLMAARCQACAALYLPPRPLCPACFGVDMAWEVLSGQGKLAAFTAVHIAPTAMIEAIHRLSTATTVVLVEQNFIVASQLAQTCVIIEEGRSVQAGMMADLVQDKPTIQRYLGAA